MFSENRKTVSVKEFSEVTGVVETTVRRWLDLGKIRGTKIDRMWLIPVTELEKITDPKVD